MPLKSYTSKFDPFENFKCHLGDSNDHAFVWMKHIFFPCETVSLDFSLHAGKQKLMNFSEGLRESLRRLSGYTWMAEELLKVTDYFLPTKPVSAVISFYF